MRKSVMKKVLSLVLAVLMILPMCTVGFIPLAQWRLTAEADITHNSNAEKYITFNVPEAIYLAPGSANMQYFLVNNQTAAGATADSAVAGVASVSATGVSATGLALSYEFDYSKTISTVSENGLVSATVNSGLALKVDGAELTTKTGNDIRFTLDTADSLVGWTAAMDGTQYFIKWTLSYLVNGVQHSTYAYTSVYCPYLGTAGAQLQQAYTGTSLKVENWAYSFIAGGHTVSGGNSYSKFLSATAAINTASTTANPNLVSPLVKFTGANQGEKGADVNYPFSNGATVPWGSSFFASTITSRPGGGVYKSETTSQGGSWNQYTEASTNNRLGIMNITVDTSRFSDYSSIPNLSVGYMQFRADNATKGNRLQWIGGIAGITASASDFVGDATATKTLSDASNVIKAVGVDTSDSTNNASVARGLYGLSGTVANGKHLLMFSYRSFDGDNNGRTSVSTIAGVHLNVTAVDKAALRNAVNDIINRGYTADMISNVSNRSAFEQAFENAQYVLTNQFATAAEISNALSVLTSARAVVQNELDAGVAVASNNITVFAVVPETIYLKPASGTMDAFEYYVNNSFDTTKLTVSTQAVADAKTGYFWFYAPGVTSVQIIISNADVSSLSHSITTGGNATGSSILGDTTNNTGGITVKPDNGVVAGTISTGTLASALSADSTKNIEWKFVYTLPDGSTQVYTKQYTVAYAPYQQITGAAAEAVHHYSDDNEAFSGVISWWQGIHGYDTNSAPTKDSSWRNFDTGGFRYPNTSGTYALSPMVNGVSIPSSDKQVDAWLTETANGTPQTVYYGYEREDGLTQEVVGVVTSTYTATVTIDASRYSLYSQVPNLKAGTLTTDREDHKKNYLTAFGVTGKSPHHGAFYSDDKYSTYISYYSDYIDDVLFAVEATATGFTWCGGINRAVASEKFYFVSVLKGSQGNYDAGAVNWCPIQVSTTDKKDLRNLVISVINSGIQPEWTENATTFNLAFSTACNVLGDPRSSTNNIDSAYKALKAAAVKYSGTAKINYRSLIKTVDTYGNTNSGYTVASVYSDINNNAVTAVNSEQQSYFCGDNIGMFSKTESGYTYLGYLTGTSIPTSYSSLPTFNTDSSVQYNGIKYADVTGTNAGKDTVTFYYMANDATLNIDIGEGTYAAGYKTVVSASAGASFTLTEPTPKTGYKFNGWVFTGAGKLNGNAYTFGFGTGCVRATYVVDPSKLHTLTINSNSGTMDMNLFCNCKHADLEGGTLATMYYEVDYDENGISISGKATPAAAGGANERNATMPIWVYLEKGKSYTISWTDDNKITEMYLLKDGNTQIRGRFYADAPGDHSTTFEAGGAQADSSMADTTWDKYSETSGWYQLRFDQNLTAGSGTTPQAFRTTNIKIVCNSTDSVPLKYVGATGDVVYLPEQGVREGYNFTNYTLANANGSLGVATDVTVANGNVIKMVPFTFGDGDNTVTANYQIKQFTVTFVDYNGTQLKQQTVNYNTSATPPSNPSRANCTFAGWSGTYTNVKKSETVVATYTTVINGTQTAIGDNMCLVRFFSWDGTLLKAELVLSGQSATPPTEAQIPVRTNATFKQWDKSTAIVQVDTDFVAQYTVAGTDEVVPSNKIVVLFKEYNGNILDTRFVDKGANVTPPTTGYGRANCDFAGWENSDKLSNVTEDVILTALYSVKIDDTVTLVEADDCLVVFKDWDAAVLKKTIVPKGGSVLAPSGLTRDNCYFYNWSSPASAFSNITTDLTVTAIYKTNGDNVIVGNDQVVVRFENFNGELVENQIISKGSNASYPDASKNPSRGDLATFKGWDKKTEQLKNITADTTVMAQFTTFTYQNGTYTYDIPLGANSFVVQFVNHDGTLYQRMVINEPCTISVPSVKPTRGGAASDYIRFAGWDKDEDADNKVYVYTDTTVTASYYIIKRSSSGREFAEKINTGDLVAVFVNYDNVVITQQLVEPGKAATDPSITSMPSRSDYNYAEFNGWDKPLTNITEDTVYKATYTVNMSGADVPITDGTYLVTYAEWDGTALHHQIVTANTAATQPDGLNPYRAGCTFTGWDASAPTQTEDDTVIKATYQTTDKNGELLVIPEDYAVVTFYDENGSTVLDKKLVKLGEVSDYTAPQKEDAQYVYTFASWSPAMTKTTADTSYTVNYTKTLKDYTVTFKCGANGTINNGTADIQKTVSYGYTPDTLPAATPSEGYAFRFWSINGTDKVLPLVTKVEGNVSYTAVFGLDDDNDGIADEDEKTVVITYKMGDKTVTENSYINFEPQNVPDANSYYKPEGQCLAYWTVSSNRVNDINNFVLSPSALIYAGEDTYSITFTAMYLPDNDGDLKADQDEKNRVTVHYMLNDIEIYSSYSQIYSYGESYTVVSPTYVKGYAPKQTVISGVMHTSDVVITVEYGEDFNENGIIDGENGDDVYYIFTYNAGTKGTVNGESTYAKQVIKDCRKEHLAQPAVVTDKYSIFKGWDRELPATVQADRTFNANYADDLDDDGVEDSADSEKKITVKFDYNADMGEVVSGYTQVNTVEGAYFEAIDLPEISPKDYYIFKGWNMSATDFFTESVTVTAIFANDRNQNGIEDFTGTDTNTVTITLDAGDGGVVDGEHTKSVSVLEGIASQFVEAFPDAQGDVFHVFKAWTPSVPTAYTENTTFTADYEVDTEATAVVIFKINGIIKKTQTVHYNETVSPPYTDPYNFTSDGHSAFSGWSSDYTHITQANTIITGSYATKLTAHTLGDFTLTKEQKCAEKGEKTRSCFCGYTETVELPQLGHSWGTWTIEKEATATTAGIKSHTCTVCNVTEKKEYVNDYSSLQRKVTFVPMSSTYFLADLTDGTTYIYEKTNVIWSTEETISFRLTAFGGADTSNMYVYVNGVLILPNDQGVYVVPAGKETVVISISNVYSEGSSGTVGTTCTHLCHSTSPIVQIFWSMACLFYKIFGINQYCTCGANHY